jgi:hypothetical protein
LCYPESNDRTEPVESYNRKKVNLMTQKLLVVIGTALIVALVGLFMALPALAQGPWGDAPFGFGPWGAGGWTMFDATAETLGLTPEQLFAELRAGKSLADVAEAQGVDLQTVYDALGAARVETMKAAIQQAVEAGQLSQEQADWLLQGQAQGFMPMRRGFGSGFVTDGTSFPAPGLMRRGFGHGFGHGFAPFWTPSVAPDSSSP